MPAPRRTPQDRKQPGDEHMFVWTAADGTVIRLPKLGSLGSGAIRRNRTKTDLDFLFSILEEVMTEAELAELDRLTLAETNQLFAGWQQDAKVSIPQS
jgi:hypothetical protein